MIKKILKNHFFGQKRYQALWERLHAWSLEGMNICAGNGSIDAGEVWVLKHIAEQVRNDASAVVFDVGANAGLYSAAVIRYFGEKVRVYSFEPSRDTYQLLRDRMSGYDNVECFNFGFSDREHSATLYTLANESALSSVYDRFRLNLAEPNGVRPARGEETIKLRTLDSFCVERNVQSVGLLKLDVEGHELRVLQGANDLLQSGSIHSIQFEFGGTQIDSRTFFRDFFALLNGKYEIFRILRDGLAPVAYNSAKHEIFLYSNYLAILRKPRLHKST